MTPLVSGCPAEGSRYGLFAGLLALFLSTLSFAVTAAADSEEAPDETEAEQTFLDEITITATRTERAVGDTPGQIDVVDRAEVEERGYTDVEDVVRYLPGVYVDGDVTRLGLSGFNIRGIGGNRVLTEIDGIPTAEQFDFGPFSVHQFALDVDTLENVEVVRSAGSAIYGSDALGGVVSLTTRRPASYLAGENSHVSARGGYDSRDEEGSLSGVVAFGNDRVQGSLLYTRRDGSELDNQGDIATENNSRTAPNPIDREQDNAVLQLSFTPDDQTEWLGTVEWFDAEAETEVLSSRNNGSPFGSAVRDIDAIDTQERTRLSLALVKTAQTVLFDTLSGRLWTQESETAQRTLEIREPRQGLARRDGLLTFDQENLGFEAELRKAIGDTTLLTYGVAFQRDDFDQLRDRTEFVIATGAPVPTSLAFPTKYFPASEVEELGAFVQAEIELWDGRLSLVPGVRFDSYDLDADQNDSVFLSGNPGTPEPVDFSEDSVSPKLGVVLALGDQVSLFGQYARGFRAPPMSSVNNGFTNQGGGYRTLPNPDLEPETSDNIELGIRGSFGRGSFSIAGFENTYEDFIDTVFLGFNPAIFLVEFQPQNIDDVEISGVEIAGELRFGEGWTGRLAYTYIDGTNETADEPLESIAPPQLVLGVRYAAPGGRWGAELIGTATESKDASDLPSTSTQFQAPSSEVFDLSAWYAFSDAWWLQLTAWNLSDETYWNWAYVRGQSQASSVIDRYTSPGRSFGAQLRFTF